MTKETKVIPLSNKIKLSKQALRSKVVYMALTHIGMGAHAEFYEESAYLSAPDDKSRQRNKLKNYVKLRSTVVNSIKSEREDISKEDIKECEVHFDSLIFILNDVRRMDLDKLQQLRLIINLFKDGKFDKDFETLKNKKDENISKS